MAVPNPAGVPDPAEAEYAPPQLPPGIAKALRVFKAHFPELLKKHPEKWVACSADGVLTIGESWDALYNRCLKTMKPDEFIVDFVMPGAIDDLDPDSLRDPA